MPFERLLSPIKVGPKTLRNRMVISGHVPGLAEHGGPSPREIAYLAARTRAGVGLQITGATPIHPTTFQDEAASHVNIDDRIIAPYRTMADAIHAEGGVILAQLAHYGATSTSHEAGVPLWAPSPVASELLRHTPHEMTVAEIKEIVAAFGAAARRVREGGLDGIEIQAAFGLLLAAFLSPYSNHRRDAYGGDMNGRMKMLLEATAAMRDAAGPGLIVGIRIPGEEYVDGGLDIGMMKEVAAALEATGHVDFFNVIAGTNLERIQRTAHWPPTPAPHGLFVPLAAEIKSVVKLPVITVGRIVDPAHAERILEEGKADLVGMTRAHIADPDIVAKIKAGRESEIRHCVGANVCISRVMHGGPLRCLHNPEAGRELSWGPVVKTSDRKRVTVIGGGPAGLEAARASAERGHQVRLIEGDTVLGGQFYLRTTIPTWKEFAHAIDWRRDQLKKLGVAVDLGHKVADADAPPIGRESDVILLATGAAPRRVKVPGVDGSPITHLAPHDVVREPRPGGENVVFWDYGGGIIAAGGIEALALRGGRVTVVTPQFAVCEDVDLIQRVPLYERLLSAGVIFVPNSDVARVDGRSVAIRNVYSYAEQTIDDVDVLVTWHGNIANDGLRASFEATGVPVKLIGDCLAPRTADLAFAEGALAARQIGSNW